MSMSQKEGVYSAVKSVIEDAGRQIVDGEKTKLSTEESKAVMEIVANGLHEGEISLSDKARAKYDTVDKLRKDYVPGLVSNWLRKDLRLNGGERYETKNPGSRAGAGDEQLKNLKLLKSTMTDDEQIAKVQEAIDNRIKELQEEKAKKIEVDMSKIPADLLERLGYDAPIVRTKNESE